MADINEKVVIITENAYRKGKRVFDAVEDITVMVGPEDEAGLSALVRKEHPVAIVIGSEKYSGPLYESLKNGALIARYGVGCDGIDFDKVKRHGLIVTNTPETLESTVAELTLFLAGEVLRRVGNAHAHMRTGNWSPAMGNDLNGKTWAIIGFGNIGSALSRILAFGFGVKVVAFKRNPSQEEAIKKETGAVIVSTDFREAVKSADIVSLHVPANKDTRHFLNAETLRHLKRGAVLINTGRGALVDESALYDCLVAGQLAGAGLDVFEHEPYVPVHPDKDLRTLDNVVLTPHIGSSTVECAKRMAERVVRNIRLRLEGDYDRMDTKTG